MDIADAVLYSRSYALGAILIGFLVPLMLALVFLGIAAFLEHRNPYAKITVFNVLAVLCLMVTPLTTFNGWTAKEAQHRQMSTQIAKDLSGKHGVEVAPQEVSETINKPYDWVDTEGTYRGRGDVQLRFHKKDGTLTVYQNKEVVELGS